MGEELEGGNLRLLLRRGLEVVAIDDEQVANRLESIAKLSGLALWARRRAPKTSTAWMRA
jgi:hypothetical protein